MKAARDCSPGNADLEISMRNSRVNTPTIPDLADMLLTPAANNRGPRFRWAWAIAPALVILFFASNPLRIALLLRALRNPRSARSLLGVQTAWSEGEGFTLTFDTYEEPGTAENPGIRVAKSFYAEARNWADRHGMTFGLSP